MRRLYNTDHLCAGIFGNPDTDSASSDKGSLKVPKQLACYALKLHSPSAQ
jgi:hypothetical protein